MIPPRRRPLAERLVSATLPSSAAKLLGLVQVLPRLFSQLVGNGGQLIRLFVARGRLLDLDFRRHFVYSRHWRRSPPVPLTWFQNRCHIATSFRANDGTPCLAGSSC